MLNQVQHERISDCFAESSPAQVSGGMASFDKPWVKKNWKLARTDLSERCLSYDVVVNCGIPWKYSDKFLN
jgi:hypothetical protein